MRVGLSCIRGNAEEIAVVEQFESRRLDLRPDQRFIRTMQALSDARARTGLGRVIAHDQFAARLQRIVKGLMHLGAVDTKVGNVVIPIEKRHAIDPASPVAQDPPMAAPPRRYWRLPGS